MKKNILSKLFCLMLALALVLSLGIAASAETATSGSLSSAISWTLEDGVLTLTGTGATPEYTSTSPFAAYKADVTSIVVDEGITKLGAYLFYQMTGITQVQLPSTLTHFQNRAFAYCTGLKQITIPESVTYLGPNAFMNSGLTDVYFESATPPSISSAGAPLGGCKYVVHVPCHSTTWSDSTIANWGGGSKSLAKDIHSFENNQCVNCGVYRCGDNIFATFADGVLTLTGTGSTDKYTASPFASLKADVTSVVIGEGITRIEEYLFYQMENITSVQLPSTLEAITLRAFAYCKGLKEITIPASVSVLGAYAFMNSGITDVYFESATPPKTVSASAPFGGCSYKVHVPCNGTWTTDTISKWGGSSKTLVLEHNYADGECTLCGASNQYCGNSITWKLADGVLTLTGTGATTAYSRDTSTNPNTINYPWASKIDTITSVVVGEGITELSSYAFAFLPQLNAVSLPQSLEKIQLGAFMYCKALEEISIPANVRVLGQEAFMNSGITDIYFEKATPPATISAAGNKILGGCTYKVHVPCNSTAWSNATISGWGGSYKNLVWDHQFEGDICSVCQGEKVYALVTDGVVESYCCTLTEACEARFTGQMIRLLKDTEETAILSKNLYIDLAGHDLSGIIERGEEELFIIDSATDEYNAENCGIFSCVDPEGNAIVPVDKVQTKLANNYRYMTIAVQGGYVANRYDLEITHISLKPGVTGVGYKAAFAGTDLVLDQIASFGYTLQLGEHVAITRTKAMDAYGVLTLRLNNYDAANHGKTALKAYPVITLVDGTVIKGEQQSITLYDLMQDINATAGEYSEQQLEAIRQMIAQNDAMQSWKLVNLWSDAATETALQAEIADITDNDALTAYFENYDAEGYIHLTQTGEAYVISPEGKPIMLKNVAPGYVSKVTAADYAQMIALGTTYVNHLDSLVYGNMKTAINEETTNEIDCSSFLKLVLGGVAYENSKYATDANTPVEGFGIQFPANPYRNTWGADRYLANDLAHYAYDQGVAFLPNADASNIQPGDVVFLSTKKTDGYFMDITHAGIFMEYKGEEVLYIFHCGNNEGTDKELVGFSTIDLNGDNVYNNSLVLIARFPV